MVKLSKSMQPENVDLAWAGQKSRIAFGKDSFQNYMALKIAGQREQCGLVIPPRPQSSSPKQLPNSTPTAAATARSTSTTAATLKAPKSISISKSPAMLERSGRSVRFVEGIKSTDDSRPKKKKTRMESMIHRLKKRHGRGNQRLDNRNKSKAKHFDQEGEDYDASLQQVEEDRITELANFFSEADKLNSSYHEDLCEQQTIKPITTMTSTPSPKRLRKIRPDLFFYGIVVKVSGYTKPDLETIKRLLQKHGGDLETYETDRVTHIIAEQLSVSFYQFYAVYEMSSLYNIA